MGLCLWVCFPSGDRLIAKYDRGNTYFVHPNALGSSQMLTDRAGNVAQDQLFFPWGRQWRNNGIAEDIRFAGMQEMDFSGLLHTTPNRDYSSTLGRSPTRIPLLSVGCVADFIASVVAIYGGFP